MTIGEAALKFNVGFATIRLWHELGIISGFKIGEELYIPVNTTMDIKYDNE